MLHNSVNIHVGLHQFSHVINKTHGPGRRNTAPPSMNTDRLVLCLRHNMWGPELLGGGLSSLSALLGSFRSGEPFHYQSPFQSLSPSEDLLNY